MHTSHRSPFLTIHTEGALLPVDLLQRILAGDKGLPGLAPEDYHLSGEKVNEAINRAWNRLQGAWAAFQTSRGRLKEGDPGTTLTRERWLLPLFQELGYGRLQTAKAIEIEGGGKDGQRPSEHRSYAISHTWGTAEMPTPIHLVGCGVDIEKRQAGVSGASKSSPHSLVQELLNRDETRLWGIVSNGLRLRILRDNASLTRQAFLEFDLEAMFSGEIYADFAVLWLVCHQSRLEGNKPEAIWLERWSLLAQEQGTRALEGLRSGVKDAIVALGQGFLAHPDNQALRQQLKSGKLDRQQYFRQLLRLVYRLIFLFVAEDRDLLLLPEATPQEKERYLKYYSTARLRRLANRQRGGRHADLWQGLKLLTDLLAGQPSPLTPLPKLGEGQGTGVGVRALGLPVLGGFLFSHKALPDLEAAQVDNQAMLNAVRSLAFTQDRNSRRSVDYKNLGSEELGSVYESLLELQPVLNVEAGTFQLITLAGNERKTTGSYYTNSGLIKITLDTALDPVIDQTLERAKEEWNREGSKSAKESLEKGFASFASSRLIALKICDPASGSGHFLIAAAHRIARRLAQLRSGDEEPSPTMIRHALREVIAHCIYGVDINPMAVELCKFNLWLEALDPGKPLTFLEAHIQCGDSLVGVAPGMDISEIPDEAFNPVLGDDKITATDLKKRNRAERGGQVSLETFIIKDENELIAWMSHQAQTLDDLPEETFEQVEQKEGNYQNYLTSSQYHHRKLELDLWTAAFFWNMEISSGNIGYVAPTQEILWRHRAGHNLSSELVQRVNELTDRLNFFHWELRFPMVFTGDNPGFDCILGNPPWDMVEFNEKEFFSDASPDIAFAATNRQRERLISNLETTNPILFHKYMISKKAIYAKRKYVQESKRYPLSSDGRINLYPIFIELTPSIVNSRGRVGIIVPSAISMDAYNAKLFSWLINNQYVESLVDFENKNELFPGVHRSYRFCILALSKRTERDRNIEFCYLCRSIEEVQNPNKRFSFSTKEIQTFSPNTFSPPILLNSMDARLAQRIYTKFGVFINKKNGENPWQASIQRMLSLSDPGDLFRSSFELKEISNFSDWIRLYSGKTIHQFNHRYASYEASNWCESSLSELQNPRYYVRTEYYVQQFEVKNRTNKKTPNKWLLSYRDIARATDERTCIAAIIPWTGCDTHCRNIYSNIEPVKLLALLLANLNSIPFDYFVKQKVISTGLGSGILEQLPVLPPRIYTNINFDFIAPRVLELVYTAYDLKPFAEIMGYTGEPFIWDEERRALLRAELDAYYTRLYGLTRDELRYILDPQDVYGPDYPGETFRVLKDKDTRQYGEYRTRRLVLEAWDRLEGVERVEEITQPVQPAISLPVEIETRPTIPEITWIPITPVVIEVREKQLKPNSRQAIGIAWLLENFGTGQSILKFDANKFAYFIQQKNLADLDIPYTEAARGPYSSQLTYHAGAYAMKKRYWEVKGDKIAKGRNMKEAIDSAPRVFTDVEQARQLIERLSQLSKDDLGGLATIDFAGRAIFDRGQAITPDHIRAYFLSDWPEKVGDPWYTDENINRTLEMLTDLGLFKKSEPDKLQPPREKEPATKAVSQPMLSDFGLYKCQACGKMVMGFDRENHAREAHKGKDVKWVKVR